MDRERLGDRVKRRRIALGLSMTRAAREAGISRPTWTAVEDGSRETEEYNYRSIERALDWAPGSMEAILAGGEPTELADQPPAPVAPSNADAVVRAIAQVLDMKLLDHLKLRTIRGIIADDYRPAADAPGEEGGQRSQAG